MSQFFELHYHLPEDPARLFDVAQGLAGRRSILKRGGTVKVKPFTETCRRLLFQCIAFAVLTALAAVLVWAFHAKLKVLFFLCLVMSLRPDPSDGRGLSQVLDAVPEGQPSRRHRHLSPPPHVRGTPPPYRAFIGWSSGTAASSVRRSSY